MDPRPYNELSPLELLELCVWREARGEEIDGMRGVAHVIMNRTWEPKWWNKHKAHDIHAVVLQPYQFSSFNAGDPNEKKWPKDGDEAFVLCCQAAEGAYQSTDADLTDGATHYYDESISWPAAWGLEADYINTLNVGRLRFFKLKTAVPPPQMPVDEPT